ncbi:type II toxin-antitoxin system RelE/ParE family toxin [Dyadobacter sp. CY107]|uniref:type II toxin-antitoxin system RelE/ParE family toxin n=1 Tax=Dyadobacter fanqingshengii TaxID=2906443 RepID=UPI001F2DB423|nr:type II toxin-antitoxin system RelE/ParE family toxin [Dyadobacter fanqingshengii]MCF2502680.1 type II toxin-antitoxin system RelE/ParE family toxin [Dyadobacter fanqingshengii]
MEKKFEVELLPEAVKFLEKLSVEAREKIYYNIKKSQYLIDAELFKKINKHIWEFRTMYKSKTYRLFAFWDEGATNNTIVIATHGIIKKTNKTPVKEIEKAENLRRQYLNERR